MGAQFVFLYLISILMGIQYPIALIWFVGIYSLFVARNIWSSWRH